MPTDSISGFVDTLRKNRLLPPARLDELTRDLQRRFPETRALVAELVRRDWLTPYQVNQLFQGRGADLLLGSYVLLDRIGEGGVWAVAWSPDGAWLASAGADKTVRLWRPDGTRGPVLTGHKLTAARQEGPSRVENERGVS